MTKQAVAFDEATIEEFKDCFLFYARDGWVTNSGQLLLIMRSLGVCATRQESVSYFSQFANNKETPRLDFPGFIQLMAKHKKQEDARGDVLAAFKAIDTKSTGFVTLADLTALLQNSGEQLHSSEVARFLRDAGIEVPHGKEKGKPQQGGKQLVDYNKLLTFLLTPVLPAKSAAGGSNGNNKVNTGSNSNKNVGAR